MKVFQTYKKNQDSSELLTQLMINCENKLLSFFNLSFTDSEITELEKLRKSRDTQYIAAFADLSKSGDLEALTKQLKQTIQQRKKPSKEELRKILNIALESKLFNDHDATVLNEALDSANNQELFEVLNQYNAHNDYM